jgi:hypothetical protein
MARDERAADESALLALYTRERERERETENPQSSSFADKSGGIKMQFARLDFGEIDICSQLCALRGSVFDCESGSTITRAVEHSRASTCKSFFFYEDFYRTSPN